MRLQIYVAYMTKYQKSESKNGKSDADIFLL